MITNPKSDQARALAKQALEWLSTPEGQQQLREAADRAAQTTKALDKARQIDPKKLKPFTI